MAAKLEEFLQRNEESLSKYRPLPAMEQIVANRLHPGHPGGVCILTCADPRVDPTQFFGLQLGEALVIRIAGGRACDALRSIAVMGTISFIGIIVVVHHTDCGGVFTTDEEVRSKLGDRAPAHASSIKDVSFGTFRSIGLEESIHHDVEEIKNWPFLDERTSVVGYALDIKTGKMRQV